MSVQSHVSPQEALHLLKRGYTYLDVRCELEFEQGHPPLAYNIPWATVMGDQLFSNKAFSASVLACFELSTPLVVGCHSGQRSHLACACLGTLGFSRLVELEHGFGGARDAFGRRMGGWQNAGLAVELEAASGRCYSALRAATEKEI